MKLLEFLNPKITWRGFLLTVSVGLGGLVVFLWFDGPFKHRQIESKLRIGLTEPEVIRLLGADPAHRYQRDDAPIDYYVEGWDRRERAITGKVLIFKLGAPICYVWFDEQGRVEDYFVGGS